LGSEEKRKCPTKKCAKSRPWRNLITRLPRANIIKQKTTFGGKAKGRGGGKGMVVGKTKTNSSWLNTKRARDPGSRKRGREKRNSEGWGLPQIRGRRGTKGKTAERRDHQRYQLYLYHKGEDGIANRGGKKKKIEVSNRVWNRPTRDTGSLQKILYL